MHLDFQRTIVALSSGVVPARRAIIRISGSRTQDILASLISVSSEQQLRAKDRLLQSKRASSTTADCRLGWHWRTVPARVYFWPDTRSFTGEPCAEIHLMGALPVVEAMLECLLGLGAELADRGEFTLRRFLAGNLDLPQAEAVLGVIEAENAGQLEIALQQLAGNLSHSVRTLKNKLLGLVAQLEAGLDFVEEDIEFISTSQLRLELNAVQQQLSLIASRLVSRGTRSRTAQVVLLGLPNAGKSSLFNALLGRERAIVSPLAGTTRDAIAAQWDASADSIELVDTAGLEELHENTPRALAQLLLQERIGRADAILYCVDLSTSVRAEWIAEQLAKLRQRAIPSLVIGTKSDLAAKDFLAEVDVRLCCRSEKDVLQLRQKIVELLEFAAGDLQSASMQRTMLRSKSSIELASTAVSRAVGLLDCEAGEELVAAELRCAMDDLAAIIGEVHSEDILGEIFSRFCIGK